MAIKADDTRLVFRSDIDTPISGATALVNHWWCYHPDLGAVLFKSHPKTRYVSPQCNASQACAEAVRSRLYPWAELRLVPVAYLRTNEQGYIG